MRKHPVYFIRQVFLSTFPTADVNELDGEYALLTREAWAKLHREFVWEMQSRGLPAWLIEKGDCDDWAWLFRAWIIERNWRQHASRVAVALAYMHYTRESGVYHAANAAVVRDGDVLTVLPIEPQPNGGPFEMTSGERESCDLVIF